MKKLTMLFVAFMMMMTCAAQSRFGLVKDEDGYTNIRKGPGTNYAIVDKVPDGSFISFAPGKGNWYKVFTCYTDGEQEMLGYIHSSKVVVPKRQGEWKSVGMVKDEDGYTNIRKGPGTKYAIVGKVKDGGYILYSGDFEAKWYKVYTQTGVFRGYMSANKILRLESPQF